MEISIKNKFGEKLDAVVEGRMDADTTVVFVHGLGTSKDENGLFVDIAASLADKFRIVRFDFSGYGKSEGRQEDVDFHKQAEDLESVLKYVRQNYSGQINILAHSMGTSVVSLLSPEGITKTIYSGIPSTDYLDSMARMKDRISSRGGTVNEAGISFYPRKDGAVQKIGPTFWRVRREFDPVVALRKYAPQTQLTIFKSLQDEITGNEGFAAYKDMKELNYMEVNGTHGFSDPADRQAVIKIIMGILEK
ncbi:alpha/beta fold hydrolase [Patescibacteria group bacterium]|nr:MAG: alpha/beta fold hydrolase [Patescibacteria group bacterium]